MSQEFLSRVAIDWASFTALTPEVRHIVFEAISDMGRMGPGLLRYRSEPFESYFSEQLGKEDASELSIADLIRDEPSQATDG
jgi:hypothetical protein